MTTKEMEIKFENTSSESPFKNVNISRQGEIVEFNSVFVDDMLREVHLYITKYSHGFVGIYKFVGNRGPITVLDTSVDEHGKQLDELFKYGISRL